MTDHLDRIERFIDINASAEKTWALVSRPGWWINDGSIIDHELRHAEDAVTVLDPVYGAFRIRTVRLEPPRQAAYRWLSDGAGRGGGADESTFLQFRISERADGVTLRVIESGFAALPVTEEQRRLRVEGNAAGWEIELAAARAYLDPLVVERSVYLALPPSRAWPLITDGRHLSRWYAFGGAEIEPRAGGAMELRWPEHGAFRGRVVSVDEPLSLAYRIAAAPDADPEHGASTLVTLALKESGDGCVLTARHEGFERLREEFGPVDGHVAAEIAGWEGGLATAAEYLMDGFLGRVEDFGPVDNWTTRWWSDD